MNAVVMVLCATAICYAIQGWDLSMWALLISATIVAAAALLKEAK